LWSLLNKIGIQDTCQGAFAEYHVDKRQHSLEIKFSSSIFAVKRERSSLKENLTIASCKVVIIAAVGLNPM